MALEFLSHQGATDQLWRNVQNTPAVVVDLDVVEKSCIAEPNSRVVRV